MEHINGFKATVTAVLAALTALWGWVGWLALLWILCMGMDVGTGMAKAAKQGNWSSSVAREGLWRKVGSIVAVLLAFIMDLFLAIVVENLPGIEFPFTYHGLLGPLVLCWYILTEAGSIAENAGELGGPVPKWLKNAIAAFRDKIDEQADDKEE